MPSLGIDNGLAFPVYQAYVCCCRLHAHVHFLLSVSVVIDAEFLTFRFFVKTLYCKQLQLLLSPNTRIEGV